MGAYRKNHLELVSAAKRAYNAEDLGLHFYDHRTVLVDIQTLHPAIDGWWGRNRFIADIRDSNAHPWVGHN